MEHSPVFPGERTFACAIRGWGVGPSLYMQHIDRVSLGHHAIDTYIVPQLGVYTASLGRFPSSREHPDADVTV
jgi:hypothetical protein